MASFWLVIGCEVTIGFVSISIQFFLADQDLSRLYREPLIPGSTDILTTIERDFTNEWQCPGQARSICILRVADMSAADTPGDQRRLISIYSLPPLPPIRYWSPDWCRLFGGSFLIPIVGLQLITSAVGYSISCFFIIRYLQFLLELLFGSFGRIRISNEYHLVIAKTPCHQRT